MTPFYENAGVKLYLGDCREVFPSLGLTPALVVADPPYNQTNHAWDKWPAGWPSVFQAVPSLWCWGSLRMFLDRHDEFSAFRMAQEIVWEKQNGSGMHNDRFRRVHELVVHFYPRNVAWSSVYHQAVRIPTGKPKRIIRRAKPQHWGKIDGGTYEMGTLRIVRSVIRARNSHNQGTNTTGKPVPIIRDLITYSCPPDGLVVDPFVGSGSTCVAAIESGRQCVGIDADERELEKAAKRCAQLPLAL